MSVQNFKRIAHFVRCALGPLEASALGGKTPAPNGGKVSSFRSKFIKGVPKFRNWVTWPRPRPLRGRFMILRREGPFSISAPNFNWIALFLQTLLRGSQNFEIGSRDPGHAHLRVALYSIRRRGPSSIFVPNLKRIAQFVQKLLRGSQNFEIRSRDPGHVQLWVVYDPYAGRDEWMKVNGWK